jgi:signal peptidase I
MIKKGFYNLSTKLVLVPWTFVLISTIIPGVGLVFFKKYMLASIFFITIVISAICGLDIFTSKYGDPVVGIILLICAVSIQIISLIVTYRVAKSKYDQNNNYDKKQNKAIATIFMNAVLLGGSGFLIIHKWNIGAIVILGYLIFNFIEYSYKDIVLPIIHLLITVVCYKIANNKGGILLPVIIWVALFIHINLYENGWSYFFSDINIHWVEGNSGYPTVRDGDVYLEKTISSYNVEICQLISFHFYDNFHKRIFSKRTYGLEGDTIKIVNGTVFVNSEELKCAGVTVSYENRGLLRTKEDYYVVPENSVFVLGDNSQVSFDSRFFGAEDINTVFASPMKIIWPLNRAKSLYSYPINANDISE